MQPGAQGQVGDFPVVPVPEPPGQPRHQRHRPAHIFIAARRGQQRVQLAVQPHELHVIVAPRRIPHARRNGPEPLPFTLTGPLRRKASHQTLHFPPQQQQFQLPGGIDAGDDDPPPWQDRHQPFPRQALQSLPHRGPPDTQGPDQRPFGKCAAGRQLQGDDALLQLLVGNVGQRPPRLTAWLCRFGFHHERSVTSYA